MYTFLIDKSLKNISCIFLSKEIVVTYLEDLEILVGRTPTLRNVLYLNSDPIYLKETFLSQKQLSLN